ncbi:MAG: amino acid adenylation domain-containing protein [Neisseriaceae bacterium]
MLSAYIYLLEQSIIKELDLPLCKLSIVPPQEKNSLLSKYSHTPFVIDPDKLFIEHFQEQCIKTPDKLAVIADDGHLNYQELDLLSSQIASRLQLMDVKHQDRVAILLDRSVKMPAAILGVLKLGAIYVPLDVNYPGQRLQYMLEDSNSRVVISTSNLVSQFESIYSKACPLFLDEVIDSTASSFIPALIRAQDAFVIFYTSGTTGKPKGVIQTHLGLINFALYENQENGLTASDNVAFYSSFGFDVSMWSLLLPLICGATTYIIPENIRYSLDEINNYLEINQISLALFPTQLCENFMKQVQNKSLRLLWTAGEKLNKYVPHQYRLINGYGPTEYTGCTTRYEVNCIEENIPIGRPLGNTWVYIVDSNLNLQPLGVPGELCIAGAQIALGYLNKDEQTRERFINNPYSDSNLNHILYKTGDIAKWLENGNLEYIGRLDDQVKIRGFRVELAEIEQVVNAIPQINEAVVLVKEDANGQKFLISYLTSDIEIDIGEIREILLKKLPDYMVPAFINQLPVMPVTTNGKIDRKYLSALEVNIATSEYQMPSSPIEKALAELWQEILKQPKIGLNDDFFSLGGNSISAIIMGASLNKQIKKIVPIKYLFTYSRLADFAKFVDSLEDTDIKHGFTEITIDHASLYQPFTMTDVQKAYLVGRENIFELGGVATHVYREDSFKLLNINKSSNVLNYLIARHPALRCVYNIDGTQRFLPNVPEYVVRIQDLRNLSEEEQNGYLLSWREELEQQIFDASTYPLFEFRVSRLSEQDILHFSFDALIMDAQSMRIFMREMTELYQKPQLQLKPLEITFRDYLLAYTELKKSQRYHMDKAYWENRLPELPFGPELVTKCNPATIGTPHFTRRTRRVDAVTWEKLAKRIQQAKISPTVPFLALYGKVLSHWSANKKFLINLTLFSREPFHNDVDNILGDFTSLELFEYGNYFDYPIGKVLAEVQELLWEDLSHNLYTGSEVQAALHRLYDVGMDKLIAPVVLTSLLGIRHNDDKFLSDDYLGRSYAITQTSQVWLDNKIYEKDGQLFIEWDFVEQLFEVEMIEEMIEAYHGFIVDLANKDWDTYLDFTLPKRDLEIVNLSNKTENPAIMPDKTMHDYFLVSAAKYPDNFAIIEPHAQYTYSDLQAKSAKLANELLTQGVMPGECVIIYSQKGWQLLAGTLGVLMSGAAYVPFNIAWPLQRLEDIIGITKVRYIILTQLQHQKLVNEEFDFELLKVIIIEDICCSDAYSSKAPQVNVGLTDLAYVIFTSGSTGKPKGVEITHLGAMNTINDINHRFNINSQDRTFCLSNISFDLSVYDIFGILAAGGTAVMPNDEMINQPEELLELLITKQVTIYNSVPALMNILVQSANVPNKACIRLVLLSGDFISLNLPKQISNTFDNAEVISLGGATEGSIWSILYPIREINPNWTSIPYGTAMGNQKIWIMDEKLKLCPVNVPGEICIGGLGVARGYLADEAKTKTQFIVHEVCGLIYRTGDLGFLHRDGNIEIMGRIDHQVKINGFRIELGEIETALASISSIKNSVVRIIEHSKTSKDIVAYVAPHVYDTLEFKLAKYGIRKFTDNEAASLILQNNAKELEVAEAVSFERKSYRGYLSDKIKLSELESLLLNPKSPIINLKGNPIPILDLNSKDIFNKLNKILLPFKAFKNIPEVLNKYRYPSAGGLYPVRLYILLGHDYAQNSGYYYYDPEQHCLIKVPVDITAIPNDGIYVSFNVFYPAIYPYYHERSEAYSYLEAGYMSYLLEVNGITTKRAILNPEMATKAEEQILVSYQLINSLPDKLNMPEDAILLVNNLTTFSCYKFQYGKFELITQIDGFFKFGQKGSNLKILRDSAAVLLLGGDDYLAIGKWTQAFTEQILEHNVGSCLFGVFDLGKDVSRLLHQRHFNTGIVLGRVNKEMIAARSLEVGGEISSNNSFVELLKEDLEELLPAYMLPQHIIILPEFPLTINGKVNIKALPVPDQVQEQSAIVLPRDKYENDFYQIWSQVLPDIAKFGVENDFFNCGGDSLKAIMLSVKIGQAFVRKIPATFVYKNRTIASQSKAIFEYLLQPTLDYVCLNSSQNNQVLILFPPFNSGTEAYYALASQLESSIKVIGVNNYFINYPAQVSNDYNALIDYYTNQAKKILEEYPAANRVFLGGWSMGGDIAVSVYQSLRADCPNLDQHVILFDTHNKLEQDEYIPIKPDLNDAYNILNPQNAVNQQFVSAGYTQTQFKYFVDCSMEILNKMHFRELNCRIFLIRCIEEIAGYYCEDINNNWGNSCNEVITRNVKANHINVLIEPELISQVATILKEELFKNNINK